MFSELVLDRMVQDGSEPLSSPVPVGQSHEVWESCGWKNVCALPESRQTGQMESELSFWWCNWQPVQGFSRISTDFQGFSRPGILFTRFKDFPEFARTVLSIIPPGLAKHSLESSVLKETS